ncbi:MAG: protease modulator HflC [Alphaproteobacteria bacterium]|nr:protease modulator HflC [Alphaproteobacteria bacterium]
MQRTLVIGGIVAAIALIILANCFYIVRVDQQAIVLQFGEQRDVVNEGDSNEAGLRFKWPVIQNIIIYDKRNLGFDLAEQEIIASDQQRLIVDAIARYRIRDPLQFFRSAQTIANAENQLRQRMIAALRGELGKVAQPDIISGQRAQLMQRIKTTLNASMTDFGVEIIDVRIRRADYPPANSQAAYERMKTDLQQKAALYRAEGEELYLRTVGDADRQVSVLLADANETSQKLRGEGDALRNAIYAAAYGKDPEFFSFYRSMQAYERSIKDGTPLVISPDSEFFRYFGNKDGR